MPLKAKTDLINLHKNRLNNTINANNFLYAIIFGCIHWFIYFTSWLVGDTLISSYMLLEVIDEFN